MKKGQITIKNKTSNSVHIDIEGVIGVPEQWQFEQPGERVATYDKFRTVVGQIKELETEEVVVNIRSTGGDVNDALLIFDALVGLSAEVTTKCYGYVASAATIIAQAAGRGRREVSANSLYLIHQSVSEASGNSEEIARSVEMLDKSDKTIAELYATRAGREVEQFGELMAENGGNGRWLTPEEVIEYGLADKIVGTAPIEASALKMVEVLGLPPIPKIVSEEKRRFNKGALKNMWNAILAIIDGGSEQEQHQKEEKKVGDGDGCAEKEEKSGEREQEEKLEVDEKMGVEINNREQNEGEQNDEIKKLRQEREQIVNLHAERVEELQNRVRELEIKNGWMAASKTTTEPKEDPTPQDTVASPNQNAYREDMRGLL